MKHLRFNVALLLIIALLVLSGCGKQLYFSFKDQQSLTDGENTWTAYGTGTYQFFWNGLVLNDKTVVCPFAFKGDISIDVVFDLNIAETETARISVAISSEATNIPSGFHGCTINAAPLAAQGAMIVESYGAPEQRAFWAGLVPGMNKMGTNKLQIIKRGNNYKFKLNGNLLADYKATLYFTDWYFFQLYGYIEDGTYDGALVIREVKISYMGTAQMI